MHGFILAFFLAWSVLHPEVADEPTGPMAHLSPAQVLQRDQAELHTTGKPGAVTFWRAEDIRAYTGTFQRLWCDDYPFWTDTGTKDALAEWDQTVRACVQAAHTLHLPRPMLVAQDFHAHDVGGSPYIWRCPTAYEMRRVIADAKRLGAHGVLLWRPAQSSAWCPYTPHSL